MASINLFKAITKATQENTAGGYKNVVLWAPRDSFTSIKTPTATPSILGDTLKITTAHTFPADEGFIGWLSKINSVTVTGGTVGEDGANEVEWKTKFVLLGDGASTQEQVVAMLNADNIFLLKDSNCLAGGPYVQMGDECNSPVANVTFDAKTTKEGLKEYTVELTGKKKYFYSGTVTLKPVGGVSTVDDPIGGSLYAVDGTYDDVALTGGTGTGATADITVAGGSVTAVVPVLGGSGYTVGDILSAAAADIGGTGSGFSVAVLSVS